MNPFGMTPGMRISYLQTYNSITTSYTVGSVNILNKSLINFQSASWLHASTHIRSIDRKTAKRQNERQMDEGRKKRQTDNSNSSTETNCLQQQCLHLYCLHLCLNSRNRTLLGNPWRQIRMPSNTPLQRSWSKMREGASLPGYRMNFISMEKYMKESSSLATYPLLMIRNDAPNKVWCGVSQCSHQVIQLLLWREESSGCE